MEGLHSAIPGWGRRADLGLSQVKEIAVVRNCTGCALASSEGLLKLTSLLWKCFSVRFWRHPIKSPVFKCLSLYLFYLESYSLSPIFPSLSSSVKSSHRIFSPAETKNLRAIAVQQKCPYSATRQTSKDLAGEQRRSFIPFPPQKGKKIPLVFFLLTLPDYKKLHLEIETLCVLSINKTQGNLETLHRSRGGSLWATCINRTLAQPGLEAISSC